MNRVTSAAAAGGALEALFVRIAATRMAGIPILHPGLRVRALGFAAEPAGPVAVGVLVTPWFMNLVRLPLAADEPMARDGETRARAVGLERFDFIGASEPGFGRYEACSLFSPMFEFVDQAAAEATAQAVLDTLRRPLPAAAVDPSRRALLLGQPPQEARR